MAIYQKWFHFLPLFLPPFFLFTLSVLPRVPPLPFLCKNKDYCLPPRGHGRQHHAQAKTDTPDRPDWAVIVKVKMQFPAQTRQGRHALVKVETNQLLAELHKPL